MRRRRSNPDAIGRTWRSAEGVREVVGSTGDGESQRFLVSTEGSPFREIVRPEDLERLIVVDESIVTGRQRALAADSERAAQEIASQTESLGGDVALEFLSQMTPAAAGRAKRTLLQMKMWDGGPIRVGRAIADRIRAGYTVESAKNGRRLVSPSGAYLDEKQLSKTAMDFAEFVSRRQGNPPRKKQDRPVDFAGYTLHIDRPEMVERTTLGPTSGDYGSDPYGDPDSEGRYHLFKMVPSGDIVDMDERTRRLKKRNPRQRMGNPARASSIMMSERRASVIAARLARGEH